MSAIRLGLIGYGNWTREAIVPALRRDGRTRIISAAAPSANTRQRLQQDLGSDVTVFNGFEALLQGPEVDAIMIVVPDTVHAQALTAVLDAGLPAFYEPPVAATRQQIRPMLQRLLTAPQITHADLELTFIPAILRARDLIREGVIGRVQTATVRLQAGWGVSPHSDLCIIDSLTPWYVGALNCLLDRQPHRVLVMDGFPSSGGDATPGRAQNYSIACLDYGGSGPHGIWATFQANLASQGELQTHLEANGSDGDVIVYPLTGEIHLRTRNPAWSMEEIPAIEPIAALAGMHECVSSFLDAVASGRPSPNNARAVAQLHLIGLAAEAAIDTGTWADVEDLQTLIDAP
ncbi:MAG: Gfo/Idh/MocA family oxidoreductase [Chloroflexi bacterium]|nr:Gfo/Idh/MocA family oxidoreductase [Chloroflexota bacterium]